MNPGAAAKPCEHDWADITWGGNEDLKYINGDLYWYGTCECGARVYEHFQSASDRPQLAGDDE